MNTTNKAPESLLNKQNGHSNLSSAQIKAQERNLVVMEYEHDNLPQEEAPIFDDSF